MTTLGAGRAAGEQPGRLQPVHPRHPDVHQHHVGVVAPRPPTRRLAVGRLAHHRDALGGVQDDAEPRADQFLVVDHQHPDRGRARPGSSSGRQPGGDGEAARLGRADGQVAAAGGDPLRDAGQAETRDPAP